MAHLAPKAILWTVFNNSSRISGTMKINRIDHIGIVFNDLAAAKAFFLDFLELAEKIG